MNKEKFNELVSETLDAGNVEGIIIENKDMIRNILSDDSINETLYNKFKENYENNYGNDYDYFLLKVQDLVYRVNILVNDILIASGIDSLDEISNAMSHYVSNDIVNFYDAVNYNEEDISAIKEEFEIKDISSI